MEAQIGGEGRRLYGPGTSELPGLRRGHLEWDLNDWKWDGERFLATPLKTVQSDCRGKQIFPVGRGACPGEPDAARGREELEKRRRVITVDGDEEVARAGGLLALNLGGVHPVAETTNHANGDGGQCKRSKVQAGSVSRGMCQVEGCGADLSEAKDYHRRHKVCEAHAKASRAVVGNSVQRFCQQCSRFHLLQEFDEGKRSCRRRLAGHNKRRRKTHPDSVGNETSLSNDQASSYLLLSLLRILSNLQANNTGQSKDQDLLCQLLKSLATLAGSFDSKNLSALLQASQDQCNNLNCARPPSDIAQPVMSRSIAANELPKSHDVRDVPVSNERIEPFVQTRTVIERAGIKNFDLNDIYNDEADDIEEFEKNENLSNPGTTSPNCPLWMLQECRQSSPPQTSGHSNSQSSDSHSSSNGDVQSRTDRIVFKLFGKDPNDFPFELRKQILGWLSSTPSDVESYIRPGCIILTLYLRLSDSAWKELSYNLSSCLRKLLGMTSSGFWQTGWIYIRMQHQMAFIYNGQLLLDTPLLQSCHSHCKVWSISPLAVSLSEKVTFTVKGFNLVRSTMRLLCSFEGDYLVEEATQCLASKRTPDNCSDVPQFLSFSCSIPSTSGRGFIEVEDQGLTSAFFPFLVAEADICTEICTLERTIDLPCSSNMLEDSIEMKSRACAMNFLHEMGWLLRRLQLMSKGENGDSCTHLFPLSRLKWLLDFSMDNDWCATVTKLLNTLVGGLVDTAGCTMEHVLSEISPLHCAVQKNSRLLVETLLKYQPDPPLGICKTKGGTGIMPSGFLFGPDTVASYGVTPLHIAASRGDALAVLDLLTDDPRQVGLMVWKNARDTSGFTPEDYARSRGFQSYLNLVEKKVGERSKTGHVVIEVSSAGNTSSRIVPEEIERTVIGRQGMEIDKGVPMPRQRSSCKLCSKQELAYIEKSRSSLLYRPAMLAMVGIAAVCVCVALLLKGPPEVLFVLSPFRWELLEYGTI